MQEGLIYEFNPSAEKIFGYTKKDVVGESIGLFIEAFHHQSHRLKVKEFSDSRVEKILSRDMFGFTKEGTEIPIHLSVAKLPSTNSNKKMFICTFLDISKEKQQEEMIARAHKMEAIGTLSSGIAHDYNNMLGVIIGHTELLMQAIDDPQQHHYIDNIRNAADRGAGLTRKLLSFSKNRQLETEIVNINDLILDNVDMIKKALTAKIAIELDLAETSVDVSINKNDFEDCLLNLCINAMHAMPTGGTIGIKTNTTYFDIDNEHNLAAGNYFHFSIEDTGCGMSKEVSEKVFDPFYTTKGEKGTGLGLSQVYGFVKQAAGFIDLHSEPNAGTRFDFYFPQAADNQDIEKQQSTRKIVSLFMRFKYVWNECSTNDSTRGRPRWGSRWARAHGSLFTANT